jgi:hypothetical protein
LDDYTIALLYHHVTHTHTHTKSKNPKIPKKAHVALEAQGARGSKHSAHLQSSQTGGPMTIGRTDGTSDPRPALEPSPSPHVGDQALGMHVSKDSPSQYTTPVALTVRRKKIISSSARSLA